MASALQEVLNPQFLSAAYTEMATAHDNPLTRFYHAPQNYDGDVVELVVFSDEREPAPINTRGAAARTQDSRSAKKLTIAPFHAFNEVVLPLGAIEYLRQADEPSLQDRGMQELRRQMELFARRHRTLRAVVLAKTLADGVVSFDRDGRVLESAASADFSVDFKVPASHKGQLDHPSGGGPLVTTAWDQTNATILADLERIREAAEYDRAPPPRHIWLHASAKQWLRENAEIKAYVVANQARADQTLAGYGSTLDLGDYVFHFLNSTYIGADGMTVRPLIPKNRAIITPEPGPWFRHFETSELVPTSEVAGMTLEDTFEKMTKVFGDFAYLKLEDNPPQVVLRMGMNFIYAFADVHAVWMPTIDF